VRGSWRLPMPLEVFFTSSTRGCRGAARPGRCLRPAMALWASSSGPAAAAGAGYLHQDAKSTRTTTTRRIDRRHRWSRTAAAQTLVGRPAQRLAANQTPNTITEGTGERRQRRPRSAFQPGRRGATEAEGMTARGSPARRPLPHPAIGASSKDRRAASRSAYASAPVHGRR
jgi:hypothetical protein